MYVGKSFKGACARPQTDPNQVVAPDPEVHAKATIGALAASRITPELTSWLLQHGIHDFIIAGGALSRGPARDLDLFPESASRVAFRAAVLATGGDDDRPGNLVLPGTPPVQLCWVPTGSVFELVHGFDFAHCQVGAAMILKSGVFVAAYVSWTTDFVIARLQGGTFYVDGSRWPLRSLVRITRVAAKLGLDDGEVRELARQVTEDVKRRGLDEEWEREFGASIGARIQP